MATYRLGSSPLIHTPGVIAWAINGFHFKADRAVLREIVVGMFPQVPGEAIEQLLTTAVPYTVEGETVVFTVEG